MQENVEKKIGDLVLSIAIKVDAIALRHLLPHPSCSLRRIKPIIDIEFSSEAALT